LKEKNMSLSNIAENAPYALGLNDFCRETGLGRSNVSNLIAAGEIKASRVGKRILIARSEVEALLERNVIKPGETA
jgi:excisionase family DNA binding protein